MLEFDELSKTAITVCRCNCKAVCIKCWNLSAFFVLTGSYVSAVVVCMLFVIMLGLRTFLIASVNQYWRTVAY